MNIYKKLLEVQKHVMGLKKDKDTKTTYNPSGYKYVTGDKVLGFIKPIMNEYGLILKQEVVRLEKEIVSYKTSKGTEKNEVLYLVWQKFTWIDTDTGETDVTEFFASGMNDWEKGLGSALTYAERYFLLKYFHIATDEDDVDNFDRKLTHEIEETKHELTDLEKIKMLTEEQQEKIILHYGVVSINDLSPMEKKEVLQAIEKKKK